MWAGNHSRKYVHGKNIWFTVSTNKVGKNIAATKGRQQRTVDRVKTNVRFLLLNPQQNLLWKENCYVATDIPEVAWVRLIQYNIGDVELFHLWMFSPFLNNTKLTWGDSLTYLFPFPKLSKRVTSNSCFKNCLKGKNNVYLDVFLDSLY